MKCIVYAVATKQLDGSWYPWIDSIHSTKDECILYWSEKYSSPVPKSRDQAIKRFYLTTSLRASKPTTPT